MLGKLGSSDMEQRAISYQAVWGSGGDFSALATDAGVSVDESTAMQINAFFACVLLISDTIATLPVDCFQRVDGNRIPLRPKPAWVDKPDIDLFRTEHFQQALISLLLDGNAFIRVFRDDMGEIVNLYVIAPNRVEVKRNSRGEIIYIVDEDYGKPLSSFDVLHTTEMRMAGALRGVSRVSELRNNLGLSVALQAFASRFFAQGAVTAGVIETPATPSKEQAKALVDGFNNRHSGFRKAHKTGLLTGGAKYVRTGVNPDEAQMIESRKLAIEEIARIFRVPPHMIGVTASGAMSYASVEQNSINFVTHTLRPYIAKLEDAYSSLLPAGAFLRFNVDGLLRGDFATRMQGYSIGIQGGFLNINDIHRLEDWKPVDGGDVYRVPLANVNLAAADLVETDKKVGMAQKLINSGFEPAAVLAALELPAISHTGVPSVQLQGVAQIDPENPTDVYGVQ